MTTYSQAMRACSPIREKYILQSRMTVNGRVPTLAETLATLNDMHARVQRMIEDSPPRTERTRAGDQEGVA